MFIFDAIEKSLCQGVSPDRISDAIKNRFSMVFGRKALDNRLQVKISERQIRFFFYDHDYGEKEWDPNGIQNNDYLKEIGFITLTRRKDAGNDILDFPQNIGYLYLYDEKDNPTDKHNLQIWKSITDCINQWAPEFYDFPFLKGWNKLDWGKIEEQNDEVVKRKKEDVFRCFVRCCLLNFIYEFENRGQSFGGSPIYDTVRDKLRESDVYKMLSAKIDYTQYLFKGHFSRNQEKYTYYSQKFADCLMDKKLNKVIPPDNFIGTKEESQGWFYNPEKELDLILGKNREHKKRGCATLKDSLVSKIRSFFYTKHAIYKAMTFNGGKAFFWITQALMGVFNVVFIIALFGFEQNWQLVYHRFWLPLVWIVLVVVFLIISGICNGKKISSVFNAFFLRIIVAETAAWLTIGVVEDLVKSMLWIESSFVIWAMVLVFVLFFSLVFGEAKQHSPYHNKGDNVAKTLLIMNHSLFFALVIGIIMQFAFYDNLLKTSNVLSDVVYKQHFDRVEDYREKLDNLDKSVGDYYRFVHEYDMGNTDFDGDNRGVAKLEGWLYKSEKDSSRVKLENRINVKTRLIKSLEESGTIISYHNQLVGALNECRGELSSLWTDSCKIKPDHRKNYELLSQKYNSLFHINTQLDSLKENKSNDIVFKHNIRWISEVTPALKKEIQSTRMHTLSDDYDTLLGWATSTGDTSTNNLCSDSLCYLDILVDEAKENKCCREVKWSPDCKVSYNLYPFLLLIHTLIVLVMAFITQLIISDKSVTEPL
jgi:hypothetical protein